MNNLYRHLAGLNVQYVPDKNDPVYVHLPYDLPPDQQAVIEQTRRILQNRERNRDRDWEMLLNYWKIGAY